jgi:hypothetical protein
LAAGHSGELVAELRAATAQHSPGFKPCSTAPRRRADRHRQLSLATTPVIRCASAAVDTGRAQNEPAFPHPGVG